MTVINGEISNQLGAKLDGTVWLAAAYHRPVDNVLVLADWADTPLEDSAFSAEAIPGPARLRVEAGSVVAEWDIVVPDEGPVEVTSLMQDSTDYPEPVILAAQAAVTRATQEANRAEAGADRVGSAEAVLDARDQATAAATTATGAAATATDQADRATTDADRAEAAAGTAAADTDALLAQHVADSRAARDAAAGSASDAASSASGAAGSAAASAGSAADAVVARQGAEAAQAEADARAEFAATQADDASDYADSAALSSTAAADSALLAGQSAAAAEVSAGNAQDAADEAADDVRATLQGYVTSATASKDAAKVSETNAKASEDAARQSAIDAAEAVSSGVADATVDSKGKLRLAGDLGGTADAPTVPGLAGKADVGHTHVPADVDGLAPVIASVNEATYQPDGSTLMRRTSSGRVSVAAPGEAAHAANKQYVDQAVLTKVDTTSTANRVYATTSSGGQTDLAWQSGTAAADSVAVRGSGGRLLVGEPTVSGHAATKNYVDTAVSSKADTTAMNARPALFSGDGAAPSTITGAVVGDWWLNTTTMELSKITGV